MTTILERQRRREVRNPVLGLPAAAQLRQLDPVTRALLAAILKDLALDARARAQISWDRHKRFMAAYWNAVAVYANHIRRALLRG